MIEYLPYARRRISRVLPPCTPSPDTPAYATKLIRVITVPAPWTPEEKWRSHQRFKDEASDEEEVDDGVFEDAVGPLEKEVATILEPEELVIWIEAAALGGRADLSTLVGMGLRGGWALFGKQSSLSEGDRWWAFKAKDCRYPSGAL